MNLDKLIQNTNQQNSTSAQNPGQINVDPNMIGNNIPDLDKNINSVSNTNFGTNNSVNNPINNSNSINNSVNNPVNINSDKQIQQNSNNLLKNNSVPETLENNNIPNPTNSFVIPQAPQNVNVNIGTNIESKKEKPKKCKINGIFRILVLFVLFLVGILSLLEVFGIFNLNINGFALNTIYPIITILSVIVLFQYRGFFAKITGSILFLFVIGGLSLILTFQSLKPNTHSLFEKDFAYNKAFPGTAIVHLNTYFGNYLINSSDTKYLLEGIYDSDRDLLSQTGFTDLGEAFLYLNEDSNWNILQKIKSELMLDLSKNKIFDLYIKNFIGNNIIDLSDVKRRKLQIDGGVGNYNITLDSKLQTGSEIDLKSILGKIEINVPKSVGVKLYYKQLAGSMELANFDVINKDNNYYESLNIKNAKNIIKINVNVGIGKFNLNWID